MPEPNGGLARIYQHLPGPLRVGAPGTRVGTIMQIASRASDASFQKVFSSRSNAASDYRHSFGRITGENSDLRAELAGRAALPSIRHEDRLARAAHPMLTLRCAKIASASKPMFSMGSARSWSYPRQITSAGRRRKIYLRLTSRSLARCACTASRGS